MQTHHCKVCIVSCIDFRIQAHLQRWAAEKLQGEPYDLVSFAGATQSLELILGQVEISRRLHATETVLLVHHEDCGAYGAAGSFETHAAALETASQRIREKHPELKVEKYYLKLDGEMVAMGVVQF